MPDACMLSPDSSIDSSSGLGKVRTIALVLLLIVVIKPVNIRSENDRESTPQVRRKKLKSKCNRPIIHMGKRACGQANPDSLEAGR